MDRKELFSLVRAERDRQDSKFGPHGGMNAYNDGERLCVLAEEFGEVARALNDSDFPNLQDELVQTAAVCIAWLETLEDWRSE